MKLVHGYREHFKKRFKERFGIDINRHDIHEINDRIKSGDNVINSIKIRNGISCHKLFVKGNKCKIIFDDRQKSVITVLTLDMKVGEQNEDCW